jgi:hypothetical protein
MKKFAQCLALLAVGLSTTAARADNLNLAAIGDFGVINGGLFLSVGANPTGSGFINSFVRINPGGSATMEQGYNTSGRPVQFDENTSPTFTHGVTFSSIAIINVGNTPCYEFLLDINQTNANPLLTLTALQIYATTGPNTLGLTPGVGFAGAQSTVPLYDLGNNTVQLDYSLNGGSGNGDMLFVIPVASLLHNNTTFPNFVLYSRFGPPPIGAFPANDGFEEWAHISGQGVPGVPTVFDNPPTAVPAPPALVLGGIGALGLIGRRLRHRRKQEPQLAV